MVLSELSSKTGFVIGDIVWVLWPVVGPNLPLSSFLSPPSPAWVWTEICGYTPPPGALSEDSFSRASPFVPLRQLFPTHGSCNIDDLRHPLRPSVPEALVHCWADTGAGPGRGPGLLLPGCQGSVDARADPRHWRRGRGGGPASIREGLFLSSVL